jgi:hypothetical protein
MPVSISGTNGITFPDNSLQTAAASPFGLKNRIINGDMRIDQRNAGASVTITNTADRTYLLDRWAAYTSVTSKFSVQQDAGAVTPPVGFNDYLGVTSLSSYLSGSADEFFIQQRIEGYNIADLAWGTASAKTVTLSFQVRSSLTGTFSGAIANSAGNRAYVFSYSIPTANTWTTISVTITGDTSGTWLTTNGTGLRLTFNLGSGSSSLGTAGSWGSTNFNGSTGSVSVVGTNGATFYITGVQLEQNTSATPFERRLYGQELANCQRYFEECANTGISQGYIASGVNQSTSQARAVLRYSVPKRTTPTVSANGTTIYWEYSSGGGSSSNISPSFDNPSSRAVLVYNGSLSITSGIGNSLHEANGATTQIWVSAEL